MSCYYWSTEIGYYEGDRFSEADQEVPQRICASDVWDGAKWVSGPQSIVPISVTRRQGRKALLGIGKLSEVEASIAAIPDQIQRLDAQIEYEADTWERKSVFLQSMWAQLGGTPADLDALFIQAAGL